MPKSKYQIFLLVYLGALSAFPPLVTDMYLPALPQMTVEFNASPLAIQLSLAACILGLACGQLVFGPLSDRFGRRPLLRASLVLFVLASVVSIFTPSVALFNVCRFFQGLGGAGGVVLSRSVATDCFNGRDLAKTMAIIGAINGIAPVAAPVVGGLMSGGIGWRGIFWLLTAIGVVLFLACVPFRESLPEERRRRLGPAGLIKAASPLLRDRAFLIYVAIFGMANAVLFSYISTSAFIIQNRYGFSQLGFSLIFAANAFSIVVGTMCSLRFRDLRGAMSAGAALALLCAVGQVINLRSGGAFIVYELMSFFMMFSVGLMFPSSTTLAMTAGKEQAGWAAAIVGAFGFMAGGVAIPLCSLGDTGYSVFTVMFVASLIALCGCRAGRRLTSSAGAPR